MYKHSDSFIHADVVIGHDVKIEPYCLIGSHHGRLRIPDGSIIRSHSVIEGGSTFAGPFQTGHHTIIRTGNQIGDDLRLGSYSSLEGGAVIGDFVRIRGRFEATRCVIGDFVNIYGGTYLTDSRLPPGPTVGPPIIGRGSTICMAAIILADVSVGAGSYIGAQSQVNKDVPALGVWTREGYFHNKTVFDLKWGGNVQPWVISYDARDAYPDRARKRVHDLATDLTALFNARKTEA